MIWHKYDINNLTEKDYEYFYALLNEDKKLRVDNFRFIDDKKRTVAGDMLARKMIAQFCGVRVQDIVFLKSQSGKPYAENQKVEFSISHSGEIVVCAVCDTPVGIDVEKIRPINLRLAKRICSDEEQKYIFSRTPHESDFSYTEDKDVVKRFFELWTKKEAYAKCIGKGISSGLLYTPKIDSIIEDGYVISVYQE